jgi:hypothetical protein
MSPLNHSRNSDTSGKNQSTTQTSKTGNIIAGMVAGMLFSGAAQAEGPTIGTPMDNGATVSSELNFTAKELAEINKSPLTGTGYGGFTIAPINKLASSTPINNTNNIASGNIPSNSDTNVTGTSNTTINPVSIANQLVQEQMHAAF